MGSRNTHGFALIQALLFENNQFKLTYESR